VKNPKIHNILFSVAGSSNVAGVQVFVRWGRH